MMPRLDWDGYFMHLADEVASRATCDRGRSGCVIVLDKRIIATGYVGSPAGLPHCDEVGHLFKSVINVDNTTSFHCVRTIHAEQNAICQAARHGQALKGATLYCKMEPCATCAMMIISVGIVRVVAKKLYQAADQTRVMFAATGVDLQVLDVCLESYVAEDKAR